MSVEDTRQAPQSCGWPFLCALGSWAPAARQNSRDIGGDGGSNGRSGSCIDSFAPCSKSGAVEWSSTGIDKAGYSEEWCSFKDRNAFSAGQHDRTEPQAARPDDDAAVDPEEPAQGEPEVADSADAAAGCLADSSPERSKASEGRPKRKAKAKSSPPKSRGATPAEASNEGSTRSSGARPKRRGRAGKAEVLSADAIKPVQLKKRTSRKGSAAAASKPSARGGQVPLGADEAFSPPAPPLAEQFEEAAARAEKAVADADDQLLVEAVAESTAAGAVKPEGGETQAGGAEETAEASAMNTRPVPGTPEHRAAVQVMVKEFVRVAVAGIRCTYVDFQSGGVAQATYTLDSKIENFTVTLDNDQGAFTCSLTQIMEAQLYMDLSVQLPSLQRLSAEDRKRALLIECCGAEQQSAQWLCILEQSQEHAERFITCVEILKMYAQARVEPDGATPQKVTEEESAV